MNTILFHDHNGSVTSKQIKEALYSVGAADCDILYIHTDMTFGLPAIKRNNLLNEIYDIFESISVETLIFPTFTFSFCNNEIFDIQNSRTPMGAINEHVRKCGRGVRSVDPLLSVYVLGDTRNLVDGLSDYSIGIGSNYDRLHNCGKEVKFLFFGADMRECFTYTHYMEAIIGVPYRYNREFSGRIINAEIQYEKKVFLYTCYANTRLNPIPVVHNAMHQRNQLHTTSVGSGNICCFYENDAFTTISDLLTDNPLCLTDGSFDVTQKNTTYNSANERIISVR